MGKLVKQKHLNLYKRYIEALIDDLSSDVLVYYSEKTRCNNCLYDTVHHTSLNRYNGTGPKPFNMGICPVCNGKGETIVEKSKTVKCIVNWVNPNENDDFVAEAGGTTEVIYAKIKTYVSEYETLKNSDYIVVDDVRTRLINIIKRGLKDNVVCTAYCKKET